MNILRSNSLLAAAGIVLGLAGCSTGPTIVQTPISFSSHRVELTREYLQDRYGITADSITIIPRMIVVHWTAIPTFDSTLALFNLEELGSTRPDIIRSGALNVSSQFLVDRDGTIHQLMPATWMARHVIGLNYLAIGIENVGGADDRDDLTAAQLSADAALVRYLVKEFPTITYLIGHDEYTRFASTPLWKERDSTYRTSKTDPGVRFMTDLRKHVSDLGLLGAP